MHDTVRWFKYKLNVMSEARMISFVIYVNQGTQGTFDSARFIHNQKEKEDDSNQEKLKFNNKKKASQKEEVATTTVYQLNHLQYQFKQQAKEIKIKSLCWLVLPKLKSVILNCGH